MVSRIENDLTEPNDYTVFLLCKELNITYEEYFLCVFGYDESDFDKIIKITKTAYLKQDRQSLKILNEFYQEKLQKNTKDQKIFHKAMVVKSALFHLDFKITSEKEQNELMGYFFELTEWQQYDFNLLESVINFIDVRKIKFYISEIIRHERLKELCNRKADSIGNIIINALETSFIQDRKKITDSFLKEAQDWREHGQNNFNFKTWLLFWTGVFETKNNIKNKKIVHAYKIATYLNCKTMIKIFDRCLKKLKIHI